MTLAAAWFLSVPRSAHWGSAAVATAVCLRSMVDLQSRGGGSLGNWFGNRNRWPHLMFIQPVYLACAIYQIMGFRQCHDPPSYCTEVFIRFVSIG